MSEEFQRFDYTQHADHKLQTEIKNHVVQVETLVLATIAFIALVSMQGTVSLVLGPDISSVYPLVFLAFIPGLVRVRNPLSALRSRLSWGLSGAGIGGAVGGALAGAISGGLGTPAGALIGLPIGFVAGFVLGPPIDGGPTIMTQGEAREYLVQHRRNWPDLEMRTIVDATEHPPTSSDCAVYMFVSDGVIKCTKADLYRWLRSECWKNRGSSTSAVDGPQRRAITLSD